MTEQQKIDEVIALLSFLQKFIDNNVSNSFTNLTFSLENLIMDYLNVFEKTDEQYENINVTQHNYPAIDLINKKKNIAVQVTTNADIKKAKKTLKTYQKNNLTFSELNLIGFVNHTKSKQPGINIYGIDYLIDLMKYGNTKQKDLIYEILKAHIPWNSLSPLSDEHCFEVVFDVIDRSAVRDYTVCEGDFQKMSKGLDEIKEIITTGRIKGKNIRAKALVEYSPQIKEKLSEIEFLVSNIIQICNFNKNQRNSDFVCLNYKEKNEIDELKEMIILKSNELSQEFNIKKKIIGSRKF